jgi:hypothetical protein
MKFYLSLLIVILFSLFLILWPIFNLFVHHGPQPPISRIIESICTLVGLIGIFVANAFWALNRRLKALEGASGSKVSSGVSC